VNKVFIGDCRDVLRDLIAKGTQVQTCVTSPPYFGLRDYGIEGQIGLEETPDDYVEKIVEVFREVRRVLKDDGTLWLNLGDSYAGSWGAQVRRESTTNGSTISRNQITNHPKRACKTGSLSRFGGLKNKDLIGIPWRVALALQADGWYLRQDIIWHKPNPMPESVRDRCTKAHEYIFLLSKGERYHYDADSISEPSTSADEVRYDNGLNGHGGGVSHSGQGSSTRKFKVPAGWDTGSGHHNAFHRKGREEETTYRTGRSGNVDRKPRPGEPESNGSNQCGSVPWEGVRRNKRSVWTVTTKPYSEAHFATYPPELIEPCILAGSRPGDIVLDPFFGSGTTGQVAERLGRQWIGIELNPEYVKLAKARTQQMGMVL